MKPFLIVAVLSAAAMLPAQATLLDSPGGITAPSGLIDFKAYDGFLTMGPELLAPSVTFTGDEGSELGAFVRDLGDNGAWGAGKRFAATAFVGELRFTFDELQRAAGGFVNHVALNGLPFGVAVSAYGDNNQIIESYTLSVATAFDSFNDGRFIGIARPLADIRSIAFKGNSVVLDDLSFTQAVPEPDRFALLLGGLAAVGWLARRRRPGRGEAA